MEIIKSFKVFEALSKSDRKKTTLNEADMELIESLIYDIKDEFGLTRVESPNNLLHIVRSLDLKEHGPVFCVSRPLSKSFIQVNFGLHHEDTFDATNPDYYVEQYLKFDEYLRETMIPAIKAMGYHIDEFSVIPCFDRSIINLLICRFA